MGIVRIDDLGGEKRYDGELRAGGVAAGVGNKPRPLDLLPIDFDQPVHRLPLQLQCLVLVAVPPGVGRRVGEPKIRR